MYIYTHTYLYVHTYTYTSRANQCACLSCTNVCQAVLPGHAADLPQVFGAQKVHRRAPEMPLARDVPSRPNLAQCAPIGTVRVALQQRRPAGTTPDKQSSHRQ